MMVVRESVHCAVARKKATDKEESTGVVSKHLRIAIMASCTLSLTIRARPCQRAGKISPITPSRLYHHHVSSAHIKVE